MAELLERYGGVVDAAAVGHLRLTERARQMLAGEDVGDSLARELLWAALRGGDPEIVRMALEHLDWPRDDSRWNNMLWSALPRGETRTAEDRDLFLECFRRVLARCDVANLRVRRTVLHDVAALDELTPDEEVLAYAKLLLAAGARLDVRDDTLKSTPLGWACRWGRVGLVKLLLGHGADAVEADAEAWATPRAWARKMGHEGVTAVLV
jgi:hypothetical protein